MSLCSASVPRIPQAGTSRRMSLKFAPQFRARVAFSLLMSGAVAAEFIREIRLSARSLARTPAWTVGSDPDDRARHRQQRVGRWFRPRPADAGATLGRRRRQCLCGGRARTRRSAVCPIKSTALRSRADLFRAVGAVREVQEEAWRQKRRCWSRSRSSALRRPRCSDCRRPKASSSAIACGEEEYGRASIDRQSLRINGVDVPVTGVAPAWLEGLYRGRAIDLWMPLRANDVDRTTPSFWAVGAAERSHRRRRARHPGRIVADLRGGAVHRPDAGGGGEHVANRPAAAGGRDRRCS